MTDKYGVFSDHPYIAIGDPKLFGPPKEPNDRDVGLNFKATTGRLGKNNDATFEKFKSLHEGDTYMDPQRRKLLEKRENKKKMLVDHPFKPCAPMKHSPTPGDFYGTYGKIDYITPLVETSKKKGEIEIPARGFYTSPGRRGSYGMNKKTLSEIQGTKGVAGEYEYIADPTSLSNAKLQGEVQASIKARVSDLPFKPANPPKRGGYGFTNTTISKGRGVVGEWEYIPPDQRGPSEPVHLPDVPFKPSSGRKTGLDGTINKFPEYVHDPEQVKVEAAIAYRKGENEKIMNGDWHPNHGPKSDMIRSVLRMNV